MARGKKSAYDSDVLQKKERQYRGGQQQRNNFPREETRPAKFESTGSIFENKFCCSWTDVHYHGISYTGSGDGGEDNDDALQNFAETAFRSDLLIVNNEGVPFLIFDGQAASATATGYFFLSFSSAVQALQGARREDAKGVWSNAKIIIVPLGVSLQLSLSETQREAINNGIAFNALSKIIVSSEGIQNAKQVELDNGNNPEKWSQIEKVPLFYIDGLKLSDGREPRYFNQLDLWREWDRQHPVILYDQQQSSRQRPRTQIVDMLDLYRTAFDNVDAFDKIANLALVPVEETVLVGKELMKISIPPNYNVKQGYLVQ
eukprot:CAMPEP_0194342864 /NCGR_PEP_ID=MMETSP0171-20130528/94189_1 /TAXON_ID=218684 /ORGANISM="Corethron pennatum, Strain L29A3" /LENGTH=316 /DNA_ID=CAMNT_0039108785 /DNA_START=59 /DNA_END=1010 /DNA_ORIENTATION=-